MRKTREDPTVIICGSGSSLPPPFLKGPSLLVKYKEKIIALDCGQGCYECMLNLKLDPCKLETIYLTHLHIDHWNGLPEIALYKIQQECPETTLIAPVEDENGVKSLVRSLANRDSLKIYPANSERPFHGEGYTLYPFPVVHGSIPAYGVKVKIGDKVVLTYTGDTSFYPELVEELIGSRIVVAEATFPSEMCGRAGEIGHMCVEEFLRLRKVLPGETLLVAFHLTLDSLRELLGRVSFHSGVLVPGPYTIL